MAKYFYKHENINKIFGKRREIVGTSVYYLILVIEQQRIYQSFIYNFSLHANTLEYTHNEYFVFVLEECVVKRSKKQGEISNKSLNKNMRNPYKNI